MKRLHKKIFSIVCGFLLFQTSKICADKIDLIPNKEVPAIKDFSKKPSFSQKLKSFFSYTEFFSAMNLNKAKAILQQKGRCLLNYQECTHRDILAISTALGFVSGYTLASPVLLTKLFSLVESKIEKRIDTSSYSRESVFALKLIFAAMVQEYLRKILPYNVFTGIPSSQGLGGALHSFGSLAYEKTSLLKLIPKGRGTLATYLLITMLIQEVSMILKEMSYMASFNNGSSVASNILAYLKTNVRCLWRKEYCQFPGETSLGRRAGLYYWLGFAIGLIARRALGKAEKDQLEKEKSVLIEVPSSLKNFFPAIKDSKKESFLWYEILGVPKNAKKQNVTTAFRQMSRTIHPDKHRLQKEKRPAEEAFQILNNAYQVSRFK